MPSIGSLYFEIRGQTTRLAADAETAGQAAGAKASKGFSSTFARGMRSFGGGIATGLGIGLFQSATTAVSSLVDILGDSVRAALEDEASQQKLGTALKANVANWDGNTAAIEETLKARMDLGFSDDEQRQSLALLVGATNDVSKALVIQRTAMDLARLKGISLAAASDALVRVEAGQFRALKSLGIELKKGATQQDALNAVQKVAAGQAEDYANTTAGKLLAAQTKLNEKMEELGYKILPVVADGLSAVVRLVEGVTGSWRDEIQSIEADTAALIEHGGSLEDVAALRERLAAGKANAWTTSEEESLARSTWALGLYQDGLEKSAAAGRHWQIVVDDLAGKRAPKFAGALDGLSDTTREFQRVTNRATRAVAHSWEQVVEILVAEAQTAIDDFFDPIETRTAILEAHRQLAADKEALRTAKTATAVHDATAAIVTDLDDQASSLADLGQQHDLTRGDVDKYKKDTEAAYAAMGKKVPAELQKVITKLYELAAFTGGSVDINVKAKVSGGVVQDFSTKSGGPRAAGGPVRAGVIYPVNERPGQREFFVPKANGYVHPTVNAGLEAMAGGGVTQHNTFNVAATSAARKPADIIREARIAARDGSLDPRRGRIA